MNKYATPTKTCNECGLQKPLSAFLQMTDSYGVTYGNVCSDCRKTDNRDKADNEADSDDTTSEHIKHRLDYKMRLADEINKKQRWREIEEEYYKERHINEEEQEKVQKIDQDDSALEKKRRQEYLEKQRLSKRSIFDTKTKPPVVVSDQAFGGEPQLTKERDIVISETVDTQKEKYKSSFFDFVKARYGESAGITSQAERAIKMAKRVAAERKIRPAEEPITETIHKLWPGGGKKR